MPDEIDNYEGMFPFYYDPRYDEEPNYFDSGTMILDENINNLAEEMLGHRLNQEQMRYVKRQLGNDGFLVRNPGDPEFTVKTQEILKRLIQARKVAANALDRSQ
jgi:hypothetical protein